MELKDMKLRGPTIILNDEAMRRLEIDNIPEVGAKLSLAAIVIVEKANQNETKSGKKQDLTIKITDMLLVGTEPEVSMENKLYKSDGSSYKKPNEKVLFVDL